MGGVGGGLGYSAWFCGMSVQLQIYGIKDGYIVGCGFVDSLFTLFKQNNT